MKWKNRLMNYNFWISIVSAILLLLQAFDFEFDILYVNEILTAILGLLVVIGIISDPTKSVVDSFSADKKDALVNKEELSTPKEQMPIEEKSENIENSDESDLQTIINKIRADLDGIMSNINSPISSSLSGEESVSEEYVYNIVNE